jgi:glycosyltransferase involved in cell wall biosynthesis
LRIGYSPTSKSRRAAYHELVVNKESSTSTPPLVSIGIIAWNEEKGICAMLESVFQQSLFAELGRRGRRCEIICVTNGCTDRTPEVVAEFFARKSSEHSDAANFSCRVMNVSQRGKINAWNRYVHSFSARDAKYLFLMDADILIHPRETPAAEGYFVQATQNILGTDVAGGFADDGFGQRPALRAALLHSRRGRAEYLPAQGPLRLR